MIDRISAFGEFVAATFKSTVEVRRSLRALSRGEITTPASVEAAPPMPPAEPERTAEPVRRARGDANPAVGATWYCGAIGGISRDAKLVATPSSP